MAILIVHINDAFLTNLKCSDQLAGLLTCRDISNARFRQIMDESPPSLAVIVEAAVAGTGMAPAAEGVHVRKLTSRLDDA